MNTRVIIVLYCQYVLTYVHGLYRFVLANVRKDINKQERKLREQGESISGLD